jgi:hypothetical protein
VIDELRFTVTPAELRAIAGALDVLDVQHGNAMLTARDGSPWLEVDVAMTHQLVRLALWRRTRAVYRVDEHGAVADDPIPGCEGTLSERVDDG